MMIYKISPKAQVRKYLIKISKNGFITMLYELDPLHKQKFDHRIYLLNLS